MLPSETMIWQPEFTDKTLSVETGAVPRAPVSDLSLYPDTFHQSPDSVHSVLLPAVPQI